MEIAARGLIGEGRDHLLSIGDRGLVLVQTEAVGPIALALALGAQISEGEPVGGHAVGIRHVVAVAVVVFQPQHSPYTTSI